MEITITTIEAGAIRPQWMQERADIDIIVPPSARIEAPITVLHLRGSLDGASYETLMEVIQQQSNLEHPRLILDFANVDYISNSGLLGLYMAGSLLQGNPVHELDGYEVASYMRSAIEDGQPLTHLHLAALNEQLGGVLEATVFAAITTIYTSIDEAISTFPSP